MKCAKIREKLIEHTEGSLDRKDTKEVQAHCSECSDCRDLFHKFREVWLSAGEPTDWEPKPGFYHMIEKRLFIEKHYESTIHKALRTTSFIVQPVAWALLFAICVWVGAVLSLSSEPTVLQTTKETEEVIYAGLSNVSAGEASDFLLDCDFESVKEQR